MESASPPTAQRLPSLTGLRFAAAALVFAFHSSLEFPFKAAGLSAQYAHWLAKAGTAGVSFFFVLSGFVLTWTAKEGEPARRFWRRRLAKVYPNHLAGWVAALVLMLSFGKAVELTTALPNLFLVQTWVPKLDQIFSMNDVSWSLCCELAFYLAFPLLHRAVRRARAERLWLWAGLVVAAIGCVPLLAEQLPAKPLFGHIGVWQFWLVYAFPPVRALEFVLGILLARIVREGKWIRLGLGAAGILALAGYLGAVEAPELFSIVAVPIVPIALLIAAAAAADLRGTFSPWRGRVMVRLGEVSFAFYVVHRLVLHYGHLAFGATSTWGTAHAAGLIALGLVLALAAAWLLHTLVENPAMRLLAGSRPRTAAPAPAAAVAGAAGADRVLSPVGSRR